MKLFEFSLFQKGIVFWLLVFPLTWGFSLFIQKDAAASLTGTIPHSIAFAFAVGITYVLWLSQCEENRSEKPVYNPLFLAPAVPLIIYTIYLTTNFFAGSVSIYTGVFPANGLLLTVIAASIPAITEELFFRKFLMDLLRGKLSGIWMMICSALLFTLAHSGNPSYTPIALAGVFTAGLFFSSVYHVSANLTNCILAHLVWNLIVAAVAGQPLSGLAVGHSIGQANVLSNTLLSGGSFGPEASILCTVGWLVAAGYAYKKSSP